jgi:hypothetical protein
MRKYAILQHSEERMQRAPLVDADEFDLWLDVFGTLLKWKQDLDLANEARNGGESDEG